MLTDEKFPTAVGRHTEGRCQVYSAGRRDRERKVESCERERDLFHSTVASRGIVRVIIMKINFGFLEVSTNRLRNLVIHTEQ